MVPRLKLKIPEIKYVVVWQHKQHEIVPMGTVVLDFRRKEWKLVGFAPPRHEGSSGRVIVRPKKGSPSGRNDQEFYPGVFNLHLKREDS